MNTLLKYTEFNSMLDFQLFWKFKFESMQTVILKFKYRINNWDNLQK